MFEDEALADPAGFLAGVAEQLTKLPAQLWRTGNKGFADIAAAMDAVAVQVDCARVGLIQEAESRGSSTPPLHRRRQTGSWSTHCTSSPVMPPGS